LGELNTYIELIGRKIAATDFSSADDIYGIQSNAAISISAIHATLLKVDPHSKGRLSVFFLYIINKDPFKQPIIIYNIALYITYVGGRYAVFIRREGLRSPQSF